jgi:nicotinate-nucleotide pyrophosphorylase (carboxylating)
MSEERSQPSLAQYLKDSVAVALAEDVGPGDLTATLVPATQRAHARIVTREDCIVCGQPWCEEVLQQTDDSIEVNWQCTEGQAAHAEQILCEIRGPARGVLTAERTILNFMQLLSATATVARRYVEAVAGTRATILDTRKTIPGLRLAQKYAVQIGGGQNHRIGLFDAILIKENHILSAGGITAAVRTAVERDNNVLIEVEVETLEQLEEGLSTGAHRLLLDNFSLTDMNKAVILRDERKSNMALEASGGITLDNVTAIAETGVDFISIGALTKDVMAIDLSMRFELLDN